MKRVNEYYKNYEYVHGGGAFEGPKVYPSKKR